MKSQAFNFHRERYLQIKEENLKANEEVDLALKRMNIDLKQEVVDTDENINDKKEKPLDISEISKMSNDLSEDKIEELYKKYKNHDKKENFSSKKTINYSNPNYKKAKNIKSTVTSKYH